MTTHQPFCYVYTRRKHAKLTHLNIFHATELRKKEGESCGVYFDTEWQGEGKCEPGLKCVYDKFGSPGQCYANGKVKFRSSQKYK